jgi:hypothetical protein
MPSIPPVVFAEFVAALPQAVNRNADKTRIIKLLFILFSKRKFLVIIVKLTNLGVLFYNVNNPFTDKQIPQNFPGKEGSGCLT